MSKVASATIKCTESELVLLINSLEMTTSAKVPCVEGGEWKAPYKTLKADLLSIRNQLIEHKRLQVIEGDIDGQSK
jgi:hypothetical protein|tara:strand:+ start:5917 stop:6144 length:228 start_codon:yes stop_codon:yes gene_type:complete